MDKEKYLGEAALKDKPEKKLNLMIRDGSVTTSKLADSAVTTDKIADCSITNKKLAANSISWDKLSKEIQDSIERGLGINLSSVTGKFYDNKILARLDVPKEYRAKGLIITYIFEDKWLTEQYQGIGESTDDWQDNNLWRPISGIDGSFPIKTRNIYDDFMGKTQNVINNELMSHITMSDLSLNLKFDDTTGDVYGETSQTSIFEDVKQENNGDIIITIKE